MVSLPKAPESPTVYVIVERECESGFRAAIGAGIMALGRGPCAIEDMPVGPAPSPDDRAQILEFLQDSYNAVGAFVAGQSPAFFDERPDAYDDIDDACTLLGEVGVIVRVPGALRATAPRLAAATRAADRILPKSTREVLVFGSGPDARALAAALGSGATHAKPAKITLAGNNATGLAMARQYPGDALPDGLLEIRHIGSTAENDRLLALMPPGSAVVRAIDEDDERETGVGAASLYPEGSVIWDMLSPATGSPFLASAVRQRDADNLTLSDRTAYHEERRFAVLETMFGAEASDAAKKKLRKAIRDT